MHENLEGPLVDIDSIKLMAESAGVSEISVEAATIVSEEVSLRLRQVIGKAQKFMTHANRTKLTCADINKSLRWSDCQPVFGYECNPNETPRYTYVPEAQVFKYDNETVDLMERFKNKPKLEDSFTQETLNEAQPNLSLEKLDIPLQQDASNYVV